jgi:hypothetical protein
MKLDLRIGTISQIWRFGDTSDKAQDSAGWRFIIDIKLQTRPTTGNDPTYDVIWNSWSNPFQCKHAGKKLKLLPPAYSIDRAISPLLFVNQATWS